MLLAATKGRYLEIKNDSICMARGTLQKNKN